MRITRQGRKEMFEGRFGCKHTCFQKQCLFEANRLDLLDISQNSQKSELIFLFFISRK